MVAVRIAVLGTFFTVQKSYEIFGELANVHLRYDEEHYLEETLRV